MRPDPLRPSALSPLTRRLIRLTPRDSSIAWLCGLAVLLLYLLFPNRIDATDGVDYAIAVKTGTNLFHPHHVLYDPFCWAVHRALALVHRFDPLRLMTTLSSVAAAVTVALLCAVLQLATRRPLLGALCALAYGLSYGTFSLGTTAEVYPFSVMCELSALWLCLRSERWRESTLLAMALASALAMLFHQTALFFALAMIYWLARERGGAAALRFCLYCGLACGLPYLGAAYTMGVRTPAALVHWLLSYVHTAQYDAGQWGSGLQAGRIPVILWGFIATLVTPAYQKYIVVRPLHLDALDVLGGAAVLALVATVACLVIASRRARPDHGSARTLHQTLWLWLLLHGLFTAWWDQTNTEFWYMLLPPLYSLVALRIARAADEDRLPVRALAALPLSLAVANFCGHIYPDSRPENSAIEGVVSALGCDRLQDGDVLIGPVNDLRSYVLYACDRTVTVTSIAEAGDGDKAAARQRYEQLLLAGQNHVYLFEPELDADFMEYYRSPRFGIEEVRAFYKPYLARAPVVGRFTWFERSWRIYRFR